MNEDEAQRMRDAIARDQTRCRCGHLLAACADCRGWMVEHSPRIAAGWRWYIAHVVFASRTKYGTDPHVPAGQLSTDAAEENDLGVYLARRFLNG